MPQAILLHELHQLFLDLLLADDGLELHGYKDTG
jgi:hypothetical protein